MQLWARATTVVSRFDTTRWRAADGSGRIIQRRLPDRPGLTEPPTAAEHRQLLTAPAQVEDYGPGRLAPEVRLPIAAGVEALTAQLYTISPPQNGPASLVTAIADLNRSHYLTAANRADVLRVLATIPTIDYRGETVDVAGRPGMTWALDTGASTEMLTFDPRTGQLLVYQSLLNTSPPGLFTYLLYLDRDRVANPTAVTLTMRRSVHPPSSAASDSWVVASP